MNSDLSKIQDLILPLLAEWNIELIDILMRRQAGNTYLILLVDKPGGGITLRECADLNIKVSGLLDNCPGILPFDYILELSSPGIDRVLTTKKDFIRVIGRQLHIFLREPAEGKLELTGILKKAEDDYLVLQAISGEITIPLENINKAKQVI